MRLFSQDVMIGQYVGINGPCGCPRGWAGLDLALVTQVHLNISTKPGSIPSAFRDMLNHADNSGSFLQWSIQCNIVSFFPTPIFTSLLTKPMRQDGMAPFTWGRPATCQQRGARGD
jgi:hypothetical protein